LVTHRSKNVFIDDTNVRIEDVGFLDKNMVLILHNVVRLVISLPLMPDVVVDYNLSSREWVIVEQEEVLGERTQVLYGSTSSGNKIMKGLDSPKVVNKFLTRVEDVRGSWNDLSEFYACKQRDVLSMDHTYVPLTVVYSHKIKKGWAKPWHIAWAWCIW